MTSHTSLNVHANDGTARLRLSVRVVNPDFAVFDAEARTDELTHITSVFIPPAHFVAVERAVRAFNAALLAETPVGSRELVGSQEEETT